MSMRLNSIPELSHIPAPREGDKIILPSRAECMDSGFFIYKGTGRIALKSAAWDIWGSRTSKLEQPGVVVHSSSSTIRIRMVNYGAPESYPTDFIKWFCYGGAHSLPSLHMTELLDGTI